MLRYIDFLPQMIQPPKLFSPAEFEAFATCVAAANTWLSAHPQVKLVNFETVVLPNIWSRYEEGSDDAALSTLPAHPDTWHQFLRCWYLET